MILAGGPMYVKMILVYVGLIISALCYLLRYTANDSTKGIYKVSRKLVAFFIQYNITKKLLVFCYNLNTKFFTLENEKILNITQLFVVWVARLGLIYRILLLIFGNLFVFEPVSSIFLILCAFNGLYRVMNRTGSFVYDNIVFMPEILTESSGVIRRTFRRVLFGQQHPNPHPQNQQNHQTNKNHENQQKQQKDKNERYTRNREKFQQRDNIHTTAIVGAAVFGGIAAYAAVENLQIAKREDIRRQEAHDNEQKRKDIAFQNKETRKDIAFQNEETRKQVEFATKNKIGLGFGLPSIFRKKDDEKP